MKQIGILGLLLCSSCSATLPRVHQVSLKEIGPGDIAYLLPKKRVRVEATATRLDVKLPARCSAKADSLGLTIPSYHGSTIAISNVKWSAYAVPDTSKAYKIDMLDGVSKKQKLMLAWAPGGIASEFSSHSEDLAPVYAKSFVKLGASVIGASVGFRGTDVAPTDCDAVAHALQDARTTLLHLRGAVDAASTREVLEYKEAKLKADIFQMESIFTGLGATVGTIVCDIDVAEAKGQKLFKWTGAGGITDLAEGCVVPPEFQGLTGAAANDPVAEQIVMDKVTQEHALTLDVHLEAWSWNTATDGCSAAKNGQAEHAWSYHFRRPAPTTIVVRDNFIAKSSASGGVRDMSERRQEWMPQLGQIACLPMVKNAIVDSKIIFDPTTGELKLVEIGSEGADFSETIEAGGGLATTVVNAAKGKSELELAKEEKELLEAQIAIEKARAELQ